MAPWFLLGFGTVDGASGGLVAGGVYAVWDTARILNSGRAVGKIEAISGIPADSSSLGRDNPSRCPNRRESKAMAASIVSVVAIYIAFAK